MASRKEYDMLFSLNAQLGSSYTGTFTKAQQQLIAMQKELDALAKSQSDIAAYQKQQAAVETTQKKLEVLQRQYNNIQAEMKETGEFSSDLANKLLAKQQQLDKGSGSLETQTRKLDQMGAALREAGVDMGDLGKASAGLSSEIAALKKNQEDAAEQAGKFGDASTQAFEAMNQAIAALGVAKLLKEVYGFYAEAARAAMDFETAMTGVEKTTDLTNAELAAMSGEIKALSAEIPLTSSELAGIAENAGQLGIYKENLMGFTRVMADLGVSTNLTGEQAAQTFAKFANITQMPQESFGNLGSTIVALGNNLATTESDIASMALNLASAGRQAGMSEADILGFAGALSSVGMEAQAGGTAFSKAMNMITIAVETGGGELEDFARVAGMSAGQFADAWRDNAAYALTEFTMGLSDVGRHGKSTAVMLDELGLTEIRMSDTLRRAAGSGDLFRSSIDLSNISWRENVALAKEAELFYGTTNNQLVLMQNAYNNLKIALGDNYTPALRELYSLSTDALKGITDWIEKNPALVKGMTAFIGVIGGVTVALAGYTAVVKLATAAKAAFATVSAAALGPIFAVTAAVAGAVAIMTALSSITREAEESAGDLSATSREQYYEMLDLEREYGHVKNAMGETSAQAQLLKKDLDDATRAFEDNKRVATLSKDEARRYIDAQNEAEEARREAARARDEGMAAIRREAGDTEILIARLEELTGAEGNNIAAKQEMLAVVELLNNRIPGLGLAFDEYAGSLNMAAGAIREANEAQEAALEYEENRASLLAASDERLRLVAKEEAALKELEAAQRLAARALEEYNRVESLWEGGGYHYFEGAYVGETAAYEAYMRDLAAARGEIIDTNQEVERLALSHGAATEAVREADVAISGLAESVDGYKAGLREGEEAARIMLEMGEYIGGVGARLDELVEGYNAAYEAALISVRGQYKLWDEAAGAVATSAETINANIESQAKYWQEYNANLANLTGRRSDIEGLGDMIASFADGSKESVNAVAGMASASDGDLKTMVANWQKLQKEQELVSESLAELETDFANAMDELQKELGAAVEAMDLSDEAMEAGRETILGFADGMFDMIPAVRRAVAEVASAGLHGLAGTYSSSFAPGSARRVRSHAGGLDYVPYDGYLALLHKGERVLTAEENRLVAMAPQLMEETLLVAMAPQLMEAMSAKSAASAAVAGPAGGHTVYEVTLAPQYNITGAESPERLEAVFNRNNEDMRGMLAEMLADIDADKDRRRYK